MQNFSFKKFLMNFYLIILIKNSQMKHPKSKIQDYISLIYVN